MMLTPSPKATRTPVKSPLSDDALVALLPMMATTKESLTWFRARHAKWKSTPRPKLRIIAALPHEKNKTIPPCRVLSHQKRKKSVELEKKVNTTPVSAATKTAECQLSTTMANNTHRDRLIAFYQTHNPSKVDTVDATLEKYAGKEEELFEKLNQKYNNDGCIPPPPPGPPSCFLQFSTGDRIRIQLFQEATPFACHNFASLCQGFSKTDDDDSKRLLHYKNCLVHRIVPNFCLQTGDFTAGNGTGGSSIYAANMSHHPRTDLWGNFADETPFVKHNAAGLLSMANNGPHRNGSQFFITLRPLPHLNGKHVVFGRVVAQDMPAVIYKLGALLTDPTTQRPLQEVRIVDCGVLSAEMDNNPNAGQKSALVKTAQTTQSSSPAAPVNTLHHSESSRFSSKDETRSVSILFDKDSMVEDGAKKLLGNTFQKSAFGTTSTSKETRSTPLFGSTLSNDNTTVATVKTSDEEGKNEDDPSSLCFGSDIAFQLSKETTSSLLGQSTFSLAKAASEATKKEEAPWSMGSGGTMSNQTASAKSSLFGQSPPSLFVKEEETTTTKNEDNLSAYGSDSASDSPKQVPHALALTSAPDNNSKEMTDMASNPAHNISIDLPPSKEQLSTLQETSKEEDWKSSALCGSAVLSAQKQPLNAPVTGQSSALFSSPLDKDAAAEAQIAFSLAPSRQTTSEGRTTMATSLTQNPALVGKPGKERDSNDAPSLLEAASASSFSFPLGSSSIGSGTQSSQVISNKTSVPTVPNRDVELPSATVNTSSPGPSQESPLASTSAPNLSDEVKITDDSAPSLEMKKQEVVETTVGDLTASGDCADHVHVEASSGSSPSFSASVVEGGDYQQASPAIVANISDPGVMDNPVSDDGPFAAAIAENASPDPDRLLNETVEQLSGDLTNEEEVPIPSPPAAPVYETPKRKQKQVEEDVRSEIKFEERQNAQRSEGNKSSYVIETSSPGRVSDLKEKLWSSDGELQFDVQPSPDKMNGANNDNSPLGVGSVEGDVGTKSLNSKGSFGCAADDLSTSSHRAKTPVASSVTDGDSTYDAIGSLHWNNRGIGDGSSMELTTRNQQREDKVVIDDWASNDLRSGKTEGLGRETHQEIFEADRGNGASSLQGVTDRIDPQLTKQHRVGFEGTNVDGVSRKWEYKTEKSPSQPESISRTDGIGAGARHPETQQLSLHIGGIRLQSVQECLTESGSHFQTFSGYDRCRLSHFCCDPLELSLSLKNFKQESVVMEAENDDAQHQQCEDKVVIDNFKSNDLSWGKAEGLGRETHREVFEADRGNGASSLHGVRNRVDPQLTKKHRVGFERTNDYGVSRKCKHTTEESPSQQESISRSVDIGAEARHPETQQLPLHIGGIRLQSVQECLTESGSHFQTFSGYDRCRLSHFCCDPLELSLSLKNFKQESVVMEAENDDAQHQQCEDKVVIDNFKSNDLSWGKAEGLGRETHREVFEADRGNGASSLQGVTNRVDPQLTKKHRVGFERTNEYGVSRKCKHTTEESPSQQESISRSDDIGAEARHPETQQLSLHIGGIRLQSVQGRLIESGIKFRALSGYDHCRVSHFCCDPLELSLSVKNFKQERVDLEAENDCAVVLVGENGVSLSPTRPDCEPTSPQRPNTLSSFTFSYTPQIARVESSRVASNPNIVHPQFDHA